MLLSKREDYTKLPEILWIQTFKYLTVKDFAKLKTVCRQLKMYTDRYPDIYKHECIRLYTSDLPLFMYPYPPIIRNNVTEMESPLGRLLNDGHKWQRLLQRAAQIKSSWTCLTFSKEPSLNIKKLGDYVFSVLKGTITL